MLIPVDDPDDERLAIFRLNERGLANRPQRRNDEGEGLFMAEGDLVVERALEAGCVPIAGLVDAARPPDVALRLAQLVPVYSGGTEVRAMVTKLGVPNTVVAVFQRPRRRRLPELMDGTRRLVLAEAVDNPANVGAIIRNAAGLGWDGLITDATSADPLSRRSLRVSMGHALVLPYARAADVPAALAQLAAAGFTIAALTPDPGAVDIDEVAQVDRLVVCVGAERVGLSNSVLAAATLPVRIPMHHGVDSLNVAAATAIACFALRSR